MPKARRSSTAAVAASMAATIMALSPPTPRTRQNRQGMRERRLPRLEVGNAFDWHGEGKLQRPLGESRSGSPSRTNGGSSRRSGPANSQALYRVPIPAGSPMVTASGG